MTVSYPVQSNIEFYRGDGGGTNQVIEFTHPFLAVDVTNAKFYLRDAVDGTLRLQLTEQSDPTQWDVSVDEIGDVTPNPDDTAGIPEGEYHYDIKVMTTTKEEVAKHGIFFLKGSISEDVAEEDPVPENTYYMSSDQKDAADNAASPDGANPFATIADVSGGDAVLKTADPTVNDDANDGYLVGTRWINQTTDKAFVCLDNTVGAAVWTETTQSGVPDGDKGDIIVSGSGSTFTIDNGVVTYAKMQDISATDRIIGRKTAGAGDPEEMTAAEVLSMIGVAAGAEVNPDLVSQAEAEAGTAITERIWNALRVKQAIAALETGGAAPLVPGGRLTLTSGTPVTTSDVTAMTTIYYTPYVGNNININGTDLTFSETSVSVPATTVTPFDIFAYDNSGVLALETLNWTNDTTRATGIAIAGDGRYYKSGDTTRLYQGTCRTTGVSGQVDDSTARRYVWNMYNRVIRKLYAGVGGAHTYTNALYRGWNNDTTIGSARTTFLIGVVEDAIEIQASFRNYNNSVNGEGMMGVGLNSTSGTITTLVYWANFPTTAWLYGQAAIGVRYPALGYNYLNLIEYGFATSLTYYNAVLDMAIRI